jgi:hypothetical protein
VLFVAAARQASMPRGAAAPPESGVPVVSEPITARSLVGRDPAVTMIIFLVLLVESVFLLACLLYL